MEDISATIELPSGNQMAAEEHVLAEQQISIKLEQKSQDGDNTCI